MSEIQYNAGPPVVASNRELNKDDSDRRARNWNFTLNNYTDLHLSKLEVYAAEYCQYLTYGFEKAPTTGTPHLQGYMQLKKQTAGQTVKNQSKILKDLFLTLANFPDKAKKYAQKGGDFVEYGEFKDSAVAKAKGRRAGGVSTKNKWEDFHKELVGGATFDSLAAKYPAMVYQRFNAVQAMQARLAPKRNFKTCVHVLFGAARCGKTIEARKIAGDDAYMTTPASGHWFDGYDGKSNVIIDELRKGQYTLGGLLSMMDQHPMQAQVKGSMVNFAPKTLVITSNLSPDDWYNQDTFDPNSRAALWGRINVCTLYEKTNGNTVKKTSYCPEGLQLYNAGLCRCWTFDEKPTVEIIEDLDEAALSLESIPETQSDLLDGSSFVEVNETSTSSLSNKKRLLVGDVPVPKKKKVAPPNKAIGAPKRIVRANAVDSIVIEDSDNDDEDPKFPSFVEPLPSMDLEAYELNTEDENSLDVNTSDVSVSDSSDEDDSQGSSLEE